MLPAMSKDSNVPTHPPSYFSQVLTDFTMQSRNGAVCSLSNLPVNTNDPDDFVLRGPEIEYEGFFDVRSSVIRAAAEDLGMVPADEYQVLQYVNDELSTVVKDLTAENERLEELIAYQRDLLEDALSRRYEEYKEYEDYE